MRSLILRVLSLVLVSTVFHAQGSVAVGPAQAARTAPRPMAGIVADHSIVDRYDHIPQVWIDEVMTMLYCYVGESHSKGMLYGMEILNVQDPRLAVNCVWTGAPEAPTNQRLRVFRTYRNLTNGWWIDTAGEEDFWTTAEAKGMMETHLDYCERTLNNPVSAFCLGWCWDMTAGSLSGGWAGEAYYPVSKASRTTPWDINTTTPCLMDYIDAVIDYNLDHPGTVTMFSTGPVDGGGNTGERGYQRWLKNEAIRGHVVNNGGYLLDYADIMCWSDTGQQSTLTWNGHDFPYIHPDNDGEYDGGDGSCHVGQTGCVRLAKAGVWLLARIAGWDGK